LPHLVRVTDFRKITLPLTVIYLANLTVLSWNYSDQNGSNPNLIQKLILLGFPGYLAILSIWRTWFSGKPSTLEA